MKIRCFAAGDEPALWKVFYSAIHEIAARDYTAQQVQAWAPVDLDKELWRDHMRSLRPFVVEWDDEVVGYADVQESGYIDHFFVSGHHPGQGIGALLMGRIHEEAKSLGLKEMTADVSLTAQPFFERYGFLVVERRYPVRRGVTIPNALMRKSLR